MRRVEQPERIWAQLWALADAADADADTEFAAREAGVPPPRPSTGAGLWRVAAQPSSSVAVAGGGEAGSGAPRGATSVQLADAARGGDQLAHAALALWHERFLRERAHMPAEDEALDDGADEYDWGVDEDFPGATG